MISLSLWNHQISSHNYKKCAARSQGHCRCVWVTLLCVGRSWKATINLSHVMIIGSRESEREWEWKSEFAFAIEILTILCALWHFYNWMQVRYIFTLVFFLSMFRFCSNNLCFTSSEKIGVSVRPSIKSKNRSNKPHPTAWRHTELSNSSAQLRVSLFLRAAYSLL